MPTIVEEEMEVVLGIRALVDLLAFPALHEWVIDVPTAPEAAVGDPVEQGARLSPWRTYNPSMLHMPPQDPCT